MCTFKATGPYGQAVIEVATAPSYLRLSPEELRVSHLPVPHEADVSEAGGATDVVRSWPAERPAPQSR